MNLNWLSAKYPFEHSRREKIDTIMLLSLFCALILVFLQPFGSLTANIIPYLLGFSIVGFLQTGITYFGFPYLFPAVFEESKWSISKAFLFLMYNFFVIGMWYHIYQVLFVKQNVFLISSGAELAESLLKILPIGVVISAFLILFKYNIFSRRHLQLSQELNQGRIDRSNLINAKPEMSQLKLVLESRECFFNTDELQYIRAEGNYVSLHTQGDQGSKGLHRATMKQVTKQLYEFPEFFRCHRSFIVNLNSICSYHGNSQGLFIRMEVDGEKIPVSRSNIKFLKSRLAQTTLKKSS